MFHIPVKTPLCGLDPCKLHQSDFNVLTVTEGSAQTMKTCSAACLKQLTKMETTLASTMIDMSGLTQAAYAT